MTKRIEKKCHVLSILLFICLTICPKYIIMYIRFYTKRIYFRGLLLMVTLKTFICVSYDSHDSAKAALRAAEQNFYSGLLTVANNLNHVKDNMVYFVRSTAEARDKRVLEFLLAQDGALPEGCHVRV